MRHSPHVSVVAREVDFPAGIPDIVAQLGTFFRRQAPRLWRTFFPVPPEGFARSGISRTAPFRLKTLPVLFAFDGDVSFRRSGLGRWRKHCQEKDGGEAADHVFAEIRHRAAPIPVP
jgi:hypothetical protein